MKNLLIIFFSEELHKSENVVIRHADYELEYFVFGNGPKTMIAFHGFNNNAHDFEPLGKIAGDVYTIISVNIFFHGSSTVHERMIDKGFSNDDLKTLFTDIYNIKPSDKFTLLGYSLGGRIVLKLLEIYPEKIDKIILLAPDGFRISPFYLFFSQTYIGRRMFRRVVFHPDKFYAFAAFLRKIRLVSEKKYQFAMNNFDNKDRREKVYQIWLTLRNVVSDKKNVKELLKKYHVKMHMFFGRYDQIIPPSIGENFRKGAEKQVYLDVLEEGHRLIKKEVLEKVLKIVETNDKKL